MSCASDCSSTKTFTSFVATSFAAVPGGVATRIDKHAIVDKGWANGSSDVVVETVDLYAVPTGFIRAPAPVSFDPALASGNRLVDDTLVSPSGEVRWTLPAAEACATGEATATLHATAPDLGSFGVLRECRSASDRRWHLFVVSDAGAVLLDQRVTPPAAFPAVQVGVLANDHRFAVSDISIGAGSTQLATIQQDGSTSSMTLPGVLLGAVGARWLARSYPTGVQLVDRDGRVIQKIEISSELDRTALHDDRLYVLSARPALPLPEDGDTISGTLRQYGADGTVLREDPVLF